MPQARHTPQADAGLLAARIPPWAGELDTLDNGRYLLRCAGQSPDEEPPGRADPG